LQGEAELDAQEAEGHVPYLPERKLRFRIHRQRFLDKSGTRLGLPGVAGAMVQARPSEAMLQCKHDCGFAIAYACSAVHRRGARKRLVFSANGFVRLAMSPHRSSTGQLRARAMLHTYSCNARQRRQRITARDME
jgi:hypothetical protein